jgi:hypothetical protein
MTANRRNSLGVRSTLVHAMTMQQAYITTHPLQVRAVLPVSPHRLRLERLDLAAVNTALICSATPRAAVTMHRKTAIFIHRRSGWGLESLFRHSDVVVQLRVVEPHLDWLAAPSAQMGGTMRPAHSACHPLWTAQCLCTPSVLHECEYRVVSQLSAVVQVQLSQYWTTAVESDESCAPVGHY